MSELHAWLIATIVSVTMINKYLASRGSFLSARVISTLKGSAHPRALFVARRGANQAIFVFEWFGVGSGGSDEMKYDVVSEGGDADA